MKKFVFISLLILLNISSLADSDEVQKIMEEISNNYYDPFEEGVLECKNDIEFSVEKPFPVLISGEVHRKKEGADSFKILEVEPKEFEAFVKPFEKQFIKQIERISLPNFVDIFRNFDLRVISKKEGLITLAGRIKGEEKNRAIKIFVKSGFVERFELLIVVPNPKEPENPRKFQTIQEFSYKEFEGVKVISQMKVDTEFVQLEADFEYTKVEGYVFPKEVLTKLGPIETSYLYRNYELVVETGEF